MFDHPLADVRAVRPELHPGASDDGGIADAGAFQQQRALDGTRGEDHLASGSVVPDGPAVPRPGTDDPATVEDEVTDLRRALNGEVAPPAHRLEECARRADPDAALDGRRREPDPPGVAVVDVGDVFPAQYARGLDDRVGDLVAWVGDRDVQRASASSHLRGAELVILDEAEDGQHGVPAPAGVPRLHQGVIVGGRAPVVDHPVDHAGAADHLASDPGVESLVRPDRLGRVLAGIVRAGHGVNEAFRHPQHRMPAPSASLQKQDRRRRVRGQPVRQHAPGGSGADDDVVEILVHAASRCSGGPVPVLHSGPSGYSAERSSFS